MLVQLEFMWGNPKQGNPFRLEAAKDAQGVGRTGIKGTKPGVGA